MKINPITEKDLEIIKEYISLDINTGDLIWIKKPSKKILVGNKAGYKMPNGYRIFNLFKRAYLNHRVVYAFLNGSCIGEVDHIDRNPSNNHPKNLRSATRSQQNINRKRPKNKTGFTGVYKHPKTTSGHKKVYCARIKLNGAYKSLGYFETAKEAHEEYLKASKIYHGEYSFGAY